MVIIYLKTKQIGDNFMKTRVNKDGCISCGICVSICPEVYRFDANGSAESAVDSIPNEKIPEAKEARDSCPVNVIDIYE